jgi:DNA-binding response OmpR family regulator
MKKELKILLIEDDENLGAITSEYLKSRGFFMSMGKKWGVRLPIICEKSI